MDVRFLRFVRQGAAAAVATTLSQAWPRLRASIELQAEIANDVGAIGSRSAALELMGPGDVCGLTPDAILHRYPEPGAQSVDVNSFAHLEFRRPDLPWMFTPCAPVSSPSGGDELMPFICLVVVKLGADVQLLAARQDAPETLEMSAAAVSRELPDLSGAMSSAHVQIDHDPGGRTVAEIIALEPHRVRSRLVAMRVLQPDTDYVACVVPVFEAGRRAGLSQDPSGAGSALAWPSAGALPLYLPVYASWMFRTGDASFRSLVAKLRPQTIPHSTRVIDATTPGPPLGVAQGPVSLERQGVLMPTAAAPTPLSAEAMQLTEDILANLDRLQTFGPPRYAGRHANIARRPGATGRGWLDSINGQPMFRAAAALGASVVREKQTEFVAECWAQAGQILRANQLRRNAELALSTLLRLERRLVTPRVRASDASLLAFSAPLLPRIRTTPHLTVYGTLVGSCAPRLLLSGAMRKVLRPNGPIARRMTRQILPMKSVDRQQIDTARLQLDLARSSIEQLAGSQQSSPAVRLAGEITAGVLARVARLRRDPVALRMRALIAQRAAAPPRPPCTPADVPSLLQTVAIGLNPATVLPTRIGRQVAISVPGHAPEIFDAILAAPRIANAMVEPLIARGLEWLLPGLDRMPVESVAIAIPNRPLMEAYMAGANHELGRELSWRSFPTDGRGTILPCFWKAGVDDIRPIHRWSGELGENTASVVVPELCVLIVRGEIVRRFPNLLPYLQRAEPDANSTSGRRPVADHDTANSIAPQFTGRPRDDVLFFGFPISPREARGQRSTPGASGYYVVFQEMLSRLTFGSAQVVAGRAYITQPLPPSDRTAQQFLRQPKRVFIHADDLIGTTS